jgi:hypothetical protein
MVAICARTWARRSVAVKRDHVWPRLARIKHVSEYWPSFSEHVVPREADGADDGVGDAGEVEGAPPGRGVDEEGLGVVAERGVGCYGSFGGWERWVEGDVAVERGGSRDDDFTALDGEGAGGRGHGAEAVDGLGDGGNGVGEEDGVWGKGRCEGFGEGLCAYASHVRRLVDGKGPCSTRGLSLLFCSWWTLPVRKRRYWAPSFLSDRSTAKPLPLLT